MRPRQSSLGIPAWRHPGRAPAGFNEAEAIKPRKQGRGPSRPAEAPGFNEAEAIKPRKRRRRQDVEARLRGFNEAEAIKPRKPPGAQTRFEAGGNASMRPRQSSLGIPAWRHPGRAPAGFNEAEAIKPRNLKEIESKYPDMGKLQ